MMVFQLILSKERDAVPIIRDFIGQNEQAMISHSNNDRRKRA